MSTRRSKSIADVMKVIGCGVIFVRACCSLLRSSLEESSAIVILGPIRIDAVT